MKSSQKIKLIFMMMLLFATSKISAQNYIQAVGLRGGIYSGVNYKNFFTNDVAFEGIITKPWKAWEFTALIEKHSPLGRSINFFLFYGVGAHIGNYDARYTRHSTGKYMVIGADAIVGIEYEFSQLPLALSVDWKPYSNLVGSAGFFVDGGAISFRYTFDR